MAKNTFTEDPSGSSSGSKPGWATQKPFRDPVSGKIVNSIGDTRPQSQVNPRPVGADYGGGLKDGSLGPKDVS